MNKTISLVFVRSAVRRWLPLLLIASAAFSRPLQAQPLPGPEVRPDTLEIRFKLDSTRVDLDFAGNGQRLDEFLRNFNTRYAGRNPLGIQLDIYAGASPEGPANHNRWLGGERGASIARALRERLGGRVGTVNIINLEARWKDFYDAVSSSGEPWRDEVLSIIRRPASKDGNALDARELALRRLQGGKVWPVLLRDYLAPLRSGGTAVLSWHPERDTVVIRETVSTRDTVVVIHESVCPPVDEGPKVAATCRSDSSLGIENQSADVGRGGAQSGS
ncbi:MAG: hypothetical protein IJV37_04215 [Bacteroidales bacterium]|nr:hypothetical protein [Bacteroidales bacterium]